MRAFNLVFAGLMFAAATEPSTTHAQGAERYQSPYGEMEASEAIVTLLENCMVKGAEQQASERLLVKYCSCMSDSIRIGTKKPLKSVAATCYSHAQRVQRDTEPSPSPFQKSSDWTSERIFYAYRGAEANLKTLPVDQRLNLAACTADAMRRRLLELGVTEKKLQKLGGKKGRALIAEYMPDVQLAVATHCSRWLPE